MVQARRGLFRDCFAFPALCAFARCEMISHPRTTCSVVLPSCLPSLTFVPTAVLEARPYVSGVGRITHPLRHGAHTPAHEALIPVQTAGAALLGAEEHGQTSPADRLADPLSCLDGLLPSPGFRSSPIEASWVNVFASWSPCLCAVARGHVRSRVPSLGRNKCRQACSSHHNRETRRETFFCVLRRWTRSTMHLWTLFTNIRTGWSPDGKDFLP